MIKRRIVTFLLCLSLGIMGFNATPKEAQAAVQSTFYVSPTGSGTSCTLASPCLLQDAQSQVRAINQIMTGDIVVYFLDGTYNLTSTFQLSESATVHDSGTNGYNVIYQAYPGANPVISGGKTLTNWSQHDTNKNIYRSYVGQSTGILQMYVNDVRAIPARGEDGPSGFSNAPNKYVVLDAFKVYNGASVTTVNDNNSAITYAGNPWSQWTYDTNRSAAGASDINNDAHYINLGGAYASYSFTGTGIDVIGEKNSNNSPSVKVYIDGTLNQTVSAISSSLLSQQTLFSISGLTAGLHTIKIVNNAPNLTLTAPTYASMSAWGNLDQVRINSLHNYAYAQCNVSSLSGGSSLTVANSCWSSVVPGYFHVNWLENAYELLNTPGQFYYNVTDGYMYYIPRSYENLSTAKVVIPQVEQLINGTGGSGTPLHNLQFIGLTFEYGTWLGPLTEIGFAGNQGNGYMTPASQQMTISANVLFNRANNILIQGNTFIHLGGTALMFKNASQNNTVIGNSFSDISGGGIEIGDLNDYANTNPADQTRNNTVVGNYISSVGVQYIAALGIFAGYNTNLQLVHNEIDSMPYSGISLGWGWGAEPSTPYSNGNNISYNKVTNVMQRIIDGGGIYTLGRQPGSVMSNNYVSGVFGPYGALYLDNGTNNYNVNNNVVQGAATNWLYVQNLSPPALNNVVTNNFADNSSLGGAPSSNGNSLANTTVVTGGNWPAAATSIMNNAGLENGYSYLKNTSGILVDDTNTAITYSGSWTADSNRKAAGAYDYKNSSHYTATSGNSVQYTFTGTGIDVISETNSDQSNNVSVYIDGVLNQTISENSSYRLSQQTVYSIRGLSSGSHTIRIVNQTTTQQRLSLDGFKVYGAYADVAVTGINLNASEVLLQTNNNFDLKPEVTISPSNASNKQIIWSSSNPKVASVANGVITGEKAGSAIVTASTLDGGFTATVPVIVTAVAVTGITLSPSQILTDVNSVIDLKPGLVFTPDNATNKQIIWSSSDSSIATVDNGVLTGRAVGNAVITATTVDGNFTATVNVKVSQNVALTATATASSYYQNNAALAPGKAIDGIISTEWASNTQINPWLQLNWTAPQIVDAITFYDRVNMVDWASGGTLTFSDGSSLAVSGIPNDGSPYTLTFPGKSITWVKFQIAGGSTTQNVGLAEFKVLRTADAKVTEVPVTGITLNPSQVLTDVNGSIDLNPGLVIAPNTATNKQVIWSSSNTSVATVVNGVVSGKAVGSTVITATTVDGNFKATVNVTVAQSVPRGYWKLDEISGTTASDSSGNNKTGTLNGGVAWVAGKISNGLSFNGTNSYINIPDATNPTAYTVSLWVNPSAATAQNIWTRTNSSGSTSAWSHQLRINSSGKFEAYTYDGAGKTVTGTTTVQIGVWYHIALVATNNGQMKLYVNGQLEGTPANIGTMWTGGTQYWLGSNAGNISGGGTWGWFKGIADEVKLYNYALTGSQIQAGIDEPFVALDLASLGIGYAAGESASGVTHDVNLPTSGTNGTIITWSSDAPNVIDTNGNVTRPLSTEYDVNVTLTATVTKGTVSDTKTFVLNVLKGVPPVDAVLSADITALTNRDVIVTINYPSNATLKEYKVGDSGVWKAYTEPVVLSANDTVYAQSKDSEGNVSNVASYPVSNIDKTPPAGATLSADITAPTKEDVHVTIDYPSDATVKEYKVGENGEWTAYGAPILLSENTMVYARGTDAAGNVSNEKSYTVSNIDHIAPSDATLLVDTTAPTNQGVTVTIDYPADAAVMEYKVGANGEWTAYTIPVVVSDNDTVYARGIDEVGNVSNVRGIMVSNIYKIAPVTTATLSPAAPNGKNSWYTTDVTASLSVSASVYGGTVTTEYKVNKGEWIVYTGSIPAFGDGTYVFGYRSKDQAGNVEDLKTVEFQVDKTAPTLSVQLDKTSIWPANHEMVTINAMLDSSDVTSGVESVVLTSITSNQPDSGKGDIEAIFGTAATSFSLRAEKSRIYTITYTATDKAGNKTVESVTVTVPHDQSGNNGETT